jgi:hypothetical protein
MAVTVDPSLPAPNDADSLLSGLGPNALFADMAGDQTIELSALGERIYTALCQAPIVVRAVHLYLDGNSTAYWQYVKQNFDDVFDGNPRHASAFAGTAHHLWQVLLAQFLDRTWVTDADIRGLTALTKMHLGALQQPGYRDALRTYTREFAVLERKLFDATEAFVRAGAAWRSGVLRSASGHQASAVAGMRLLQDEFPRLRDAYQNTFEACCDSLWVIALIRNFASSGAHHPYRSCPTLITVWSGRCAVWPRSGSWPIAANWPLCGGMTGCSRYLRHWTQSSETRSVTRALVTTYSWASSAMSAEMRSTTSTLSLGCTAWFFL